MKARFRIRDLELIVALHEEGTVTRAAKRVSISEPAVSKRLQAVEREVGAKLFERNHDGVKVTEIGRPFVEHVRESLHYYDRAFHEAREAKRGQHHTLHIGASAYLPPDLIEFARTTELRLYRELSVEIVTDYSLELLDQLQRRKLDLALVTTPPELAKITALRVAKFPFMIVFRDNHPLAINSSVNLAQVAGYPWIFFHRNIHSYLYDMVLRRAAAEGLKPNIAHHFIQAEQITAFLTEESVAWMTPFEAKRITRRGLKAIPLKDSQIRLDTHIVARAEDKSPLVSEYVRAFAKRMEEQRSPEQLILPITAYIA